MKNKCIFARLTTAVRLVSGSYERAAGVICRQKRHVARVLEPNIIGQPAAN